MCVIAYSPAGTAIPKESDLKLMFEKNSHGAGFAITRPDGFVEWHKGYMSFESFMSKLNEFSTQELGDNPVTLHFRIKTKGDIDGETTHPFPLSPQFSDMRKLHGISQNAVVFHNGSISGFGGIASEVSSDTQDFVMGPLFYIMKGVKPGRKLGKLRQTAIEQLIGTSRLLIMNANGETLKIGSGWAEAADGCSYSNMLWKTSTVATRSTTNYPRYGSYGYYGSASASASTEEDKKEEKTEEKKKEKQTVLKEPDEYGRHAYPGVWPGQGKEWIEFKDEKVLEKATRFMTTIIREGETLYKERISGNLYHKHGDRSLLTEKGLEMMADYYIDQYGYGTEELAQMVKDGQINFESLNDLSEFLELTKENEEGAYEYEGQEWYADYDSLTLTTKDFLVAFFDDKIDEVIESLVTVGHIKDELYEDMEINPDEDTDTIKLDLEELTIEEKAKEVEKRITQATASA